MSARRIGETIRWRLHLPVPREAVFEALTTDAGRAAFWAESATERDGVIHFRFAGGETTESRVLESRPPEVFALDYFGAVARFELTSDGDGGTDLVLTHEDVVPDQWIETHAGWLNVLLPLKAWLVGAIDLRNHDPARSWSRGYVDQ